MDEPLVRTVPRQAFLAAIDGGLEKWMQHEERTRGKATPSRALTTAALAALAPAIDLLRERARTHTLVAVRVSSQQITLRVAGDRVNNVRYRLRMRIGRDARSILYAEEETDAGAICVRPVCELLDREHLRISVDVRYRDEKYGTVILGAVQPEPPMDTIDVDLDDLPGTPEYRRRLYEAVRHTYRVAHDEPAVGRRVKEFAERELGISVDRLKNLLSPPRVALTVQVLRLGRIEIVEVGMRAVAGGGAVIEFEEVRSEPQLERIEGTPDVVALMRDMAAYETAGADDGVKTLFETMAVMYADSSELADQQAFVDRARDIGMSAVRPLAAYLEQHGAIENAEAWIEEQADALIGARRADSLYGAYHAQAARRKRREIERVTFLGKQLALIAARDLPTRDDDPETGIIRAARDGVALYGRRPVFVPPLDQFFDNLLMWIPIAARTLERARAGTRGGSESA